MQEHINESVNSQTELENCKEMIISFKKALMLTSQDGIDYFTSPSHIFKEFSVLMTSLYRINAFESDTNVHYTGILEVDFFLDIIQRLRREEWLDIEEGDVIDFSEVIEKFLYEFIPLRVSKDTGFNVDFIKTFRSPEEFFRKFISLVDVLEPPSYDEALEVLRAFETFIEMNGLYDVKNKKVLLHQSRFTDDHLLLFIYDQTSSLKSYYDPSFDILVEFCNQNNCTYNKQVGAHYEQNQDKLQRVMFLKKLIKSFRASRFGYQSLYEAFDIQSAVEKIMLSDEEETIISIFKDFSIFLAIIGASTYRNDGKIFYLTHSPYDLLMLIGIHENLFGPKAECSDDVATLTSKAYKHTDNSIPGSFDDGPLSKDFDIKSLKSTLKRYYGVSF